MRYAIVENGIVTNIAVSNRPLAGTWHAIPTGCPVDIGDTFDGSLFRSPDGEIRLTAEARVMLAQLSDFETAYMEGVQNA